MNRFFLFVIMMAFPYFTLAITYDTQTFFDVPQERADFIYIEDLVRRGIIDSGQLFRPDDKINRAELTKLVVSATLWPAFDEIENNKSFPDVDKNAWHWPYIESAKYYRMIDWYPDWSYKPENNINKAETLKVIFLSTWIKLKSYVNYFHDANNWEWFIKYANSAYEYWIDKWIQDYWNSMLKFDPSHEVTRWEVATYLSKALSVSKFYTKENYQKNISK